MLKTCFKNNEEMCKLCTKMYLEKVLKC